MANDERQTGRAGWGRRVAGTAAWVALLGVLGWLGARSATRLERPATLVLPTIDAATFLAQVAPATSAPPPCPDAERVPGGVLADGRVVLNRAGVRDLMTLPGVGEKRARGIVALRTRLGRFRSLRDLLRVKGLGPRRLRALEAKCVLDPPDEGSDTRSSIGGVGDAATRPTTERGAAPAAHGPRRSGA
ncbi:MAG: helix-hairpin-helix domain-containing protein [Deltaproteobacteria bacterium]|nr:helix-hairpin-helix domain-containing protein [Deltaproteobacteria bacterium]